MPWVWPLRRSETRATTLDAAGVVDATGTKTVLDRILNSPEFASANRLQQLLSFVVEQRIAGAVSIKETEIAISVFNRKSSFDPSGDSVVRVAASNLRSRLRDYYLGTGARDPVVIDLPKGSYVPVFRKGAPAVGQGSRRRPLAWLLALGLTIATLAASYSMLRARFQPRWSSVAVLPFLNLSSNPETEYLAQGFVDEVTTALAQVEGLRVAARSSAFQFRGRNPDIRSAGRQLGVDAVVEGSIRTVEGRLRISVQLINVADGFHIWSRTWDGAPAELFDIQAEVTRSVAAELHHPVAARSDTPATPEAYDLYLKGQFFKDRETLPDYARSIDYLKRSVSRDPRYAPAHAALADAYASLAYHELLFDAEAVDNAKAAALGALSLDSNLAEAHAVLAFIRFSCDWDLAAGEKGLRRALELNPNSARAHDWYGQVLFAGGRTEAALEQSRRALLLDPLNYRASTGVAVVLYIGHRWDEAIAQARQALELNPHFFLAHTIAGASLYEKHRFAEAVAELRLAVAENPIDADSLAHLAVAEFAAGDPAAARQSLDSLERMKPRPDYQLAFLYLAQGRRGEALAALEQAMAARSTDMVVMSVDPVFDALHPEPRFQALQQRIGWMPPK